MIRPGMFIEDRYEILEKIGSGGMSDVYKARCHKLNRYVAIKFLKQEFCEDKSFVSKFQIEAQSAAALLHPNVVSVYDVNEVDGVYYIVMEYVDGITLKQYIDRNGRLPIKEATSIAIQVGQGIEAAHNANIIHRDIKPQNVLISREGKIKVTDFGIARTTTANTISRDILGSVHYISPEQARGGQVDERSDIYSFGIVFYEMVTGQLPFDGDSTVTIALKHIQENVPLVSDIIPSVPSSVVRIIEKCTQKRPERRYQKMTSLLADLKTSLISPNEDFVVLEPETQENATILMTGAEAAALREEARRMRRAELEEFDDGTEYEEVDYDEDDEGYYDDYENTKVSRNKGKDSSNKKMNKVFLIIGIIVGAILVVILAVVGIRALIGGGGCSGSKKEQVEVADVAGMEMTAAQRQIEDQGFEVKIVYEESDTIAENRVISQSPKAGTKAEKGSTVTLTISSGKTKQKLENYVGRMQEDAQKALSKLNIQTKITTRYSDDVEIGRVIETIPAAGTDISKDTVVELIVSRGPEKKTVTVPNLIGTNMQDAENTLYNLGFYVIEYFVETEDSNVGKVINQSLGAGSVVDAGTSITIAIGKERQTQPPDPPEPTTEEQTN